MATSSISLRRSLAIQFRVIGALLMREVLTRYGRHNIGFLWLFVEPMLFTLGVTALWMMSKETHGSNLPIVAFAVTGYSSVLLWRNMPNRCCSAIEPNLALMYHRHVKIIDIFASRILLEIAGTTTCFITLAFFFTAVGLMKAPEDIFKIMLGWFMIAWFGAALALLIGALCARSEIVEKMWHPMAYLLFPLSGAMFMVNWLPPAAQKIVLLLPMVHGVEVLREGYFGSMLHAHYDIAYMSTCNLVLTLLGLAQERVVSRQVTPE
jgi:capsular polysaccharide transport system permease protein